jgi:hypothetical protein
MDFICREPSRIIFMPTARANAMPALDCPLEAGTGQHHGQNASIQEQCAGAVCQLMRQRSGLPSAREISISDETPGRGAAIGLFAAPVLPAEAGLNRLCCRESLFEPSVSIALSANIDWRLQLADIKNPIGTERDPERTQADRVFNGSDMVFQTTRRKKTLSALSAILSAFRLIGFFRNN